MRFLVLKAGRASRQTRDRIGDYDRQFIDLLAQPGQQWETHDVAGGAFPASLADCGGVVITGSPASAYDDDPWISRLLALIREAHGRGVPLLGICFGAQCVARALGGQAAPNPQGWDLGLVELALTDAGRRWPPLAGAPQPLRILQSHQDIVSEPPPGAVVLAASPRTPVEVFTVGERVLCLQGHPEMDRAEVRELLEKRRDRGLLDAGRAAEGLASLREAPHRAFLQGWLQTFLRDGRLPSAA